MSNFIKPTKHPKTGIVEQASWLDDYFGHHKYGVRFPSDNLVYDPIEIDDDFVDVVLKEQELNEEQKRILFYWGLKGNEYNGYDPYEFCYVYADISAITGVSVDKLKKEMKALRDLGYVRFAKGLISEDGEVVGSGHILVYEKRKEILSFFCDNREFIETTELIFDKQLNGKQADLLLKELSKKISQARNDEQNKIKVNIGFLRQWLNEKPENLLVTNEQIEEWLFNFEPTERKNEK